MNRPLVLFKVKLGGKPNGRNIEQHDMFFGIGTTLADLATDIKRFWPQLKGKIHIDTWQKVTSVGEYKIVIVPRKEYKETELKLYFANLGWYRKDHDREEHESVFVAEKSIVRAVVAVKQTTIFKHLLEKGYSGPNASTHVDDKFAPDDVFDVTRAIPKRILRKYAISLQKKERNEVLVPDELYITGFLHVDKLDEYVANH